MKKNFALVLMCIGCFTAISCNKMPSDMYPKSVGAFQLKEGSPPYKDPKGYMNFYGKYDSPDGSRISCGAFDTASDEEAMMNLSRIYINDDTHPTTPILDKSGKQIGIKLINDRPGSTASLDWNIGKRVYGCIAEAPAKTLVEFFNNWQDQTSR